MTGRLREWLDRCHACLREVDELFRRGDVRPPFLMEVDGIMTQVRMAPVLSSFPDTRPRALAMELTDTIIPAMKREKPSLVDTLIVFAKSLEKLDRGVASICEGRTRSAIVAEVMGATLSDCRERYRGLMDSLGDPSPEPDQSGSENKFRREGKVWRLSFDGKQAVLNHLVGLIYIQEILVSKAPIISSTELVAAAADPLPEGTPVITNRRELELEGSGTGYRGSVSDGKTVRECRARRKEIELEQAEAEEDGNCEAYDVLDHEAKKIDEYLRGALGLGGRLRDAPAENENVRKNVEKAIRRAREAIAEVHPSLAEHLRDSIDVGGNCAYLADPRPNWTT